MENLLDDSVPVLDRDVWPYAVGQLGGILIAVGAFLMLRGAAVSGYDTFVGGAVTLGIAWTRLAKSHNTIAPAVGSFAIVAAFLCSRGPTNSVDEVHAAALGLGFSFVIFALTYVFASRLTAVRVFAGIAALPALGVAAAIQQRAATDANVDLMLKIMLVCFLLMGVSLMLTLPKLRTIRA
jgi:hypothetical protein